MNEVVLGKGVTIVGIEIITLLTGVLKLLTGVFTLLTAYHYDRDLKMVSETVSPPKVYRVSMLVFQRWPETEIG